MSLLICPGVHPVSLTQSFLDGLKLERRGDLLIFPSQEYPPYSPQAVFEFLTQSLGQPVQAQPLLLIGFSAGVVGAMGAAIAWQLSGGTIKALIAIDGWGVPVIGGFPVYRVSHDYFTHWSSALLGKGEDSFYAEPEVEHLNLWTNPDTVAGWRESTQGCRIYCTVAQFLTCLLAKYEET